MARALGAFLAVFSILSLLVNLDVLGGVFGIGALSLFVVGELAAQFASTSVFQDSRRTLVLRIESQKIGDPLTPPRSYAAEIPRRVRLFGFS
jgi:hypothetical protein